MDMKEFRLGLRQGLPYAAVASVLLIRRVPLVVVCGIAVLVTAGLRWLT